MREGRERSEWSRCSVQLALIANGFASMGKGGKKFKPEDFDPYQQQDQKPIGVQALGAIMGWKKTPKPKGPPCDSSSPRSESSPSSS